MSLSNLYAYHGSNISLKIIGLNFTDQQTYQHDHTVTLRDRIELERLLSCHTQIHSQIQGLVFYDGNSDSKIQFDKILLYFGDSVNIRCC